MFTLPTLHKRALPQLTAQSVAVTLGQCRKTGNVKSQPLLSAWCLKNWHISHKCGCCGSMGHTNFAMATSTTILETWGNEGPCTKRHSSLQAAMPFQINTSIKSKTHRSVTTASCTEICVGETFIAVMSSPNENQM